MLVFATALSIGGLLASVAAAKVAFKTPPSAVLQGTTLTADVVTVGGIDIECKEVTFDGALRDAKTLELEPVFDDCSAKAFAGLPAKFVMSGCVYVVHPVEEMGGGERWRASVDIECPGEYTLEWHVYETEAKFAAGWAMCTPVLLPQTDIGRAVLTNLGGSRGKVSIRWDLTEITYKAYGLPLFCGSVFGATKHGATYRGDAVIGAETYGGKPADLSLRD